MILQMFTLMPCEITILIYSIFSKNLYSHKEFGFRVLDGTRYITIPVTIIIVYNRILKKGFVAYKFILDFQC